MGEKVFEIRKLKVFGLIMNLFFMIVIISCGIKNKTSKIKEERVLNSNKALNKGIYFLKYYYEENPEKILWTNGSSRVINKDKSFCLLSFDLKDVHKSNYKQCFNEIGIPIGDGTESDFTKVYADSIRMKFKKRDTTFLIRTETLKDPSTLWFWKYFPKKNETVIVNLLTKNFITNKIEIKQVSHTYLGIDTIKLNGNLKAYYSVYSKAVNGQEGVYDKRWYDENGMVVKEKHVVGTNGTRIAELSQIIKAN